MKNWAVFVLFQPRKLSAAKPTGAIRVYAAAAYRDVGGEEIIPSWSSAALAGGKSAPACSRWKPDGSTGPRSRMKGAVSHQWGL